MDLFWDKVLQISSQGTVMLSIYFEKGSQNHKTQLPFSQLLPVKSASFANKALELEFCLLFHWGVVVMVVISWSSKSKLNQNYTEIYLCYILSLRIWLAMLLTVVGWNRCLGSTVLRNKKYYRLWTVDRDKVMKKDKREKI